MRKKSSPLSKTEEELIAAFKQVSYEAKMLEYCGNLLQFPERPQGLEFAVLLESFLIHARNLNDFFCGLERVNDEASLEQIRRGLPENDVIVEEFFVGNIPWEKQPRNLLTKEQRDSINRQLAHISYDRTISTQDTWDFEGIQERLRRMFDEFISTAPLVRYHPELLEELIEEPPGGNYFYP